MTDQEKDLLLDEALDICEQQSRHATPEQVAKLADDAALREACCDLLTAGRVLREQSAPVDVDRQWQRFNKHTRHHGSCRVMWCVLFAAAAAAVVLLVVSHPWMQQPVLPANSNEPLVVYQGDVACKPVSVITQRGDTVSVTSPKSVERMIDQANENHVEEALTVHVPKGETYSLMLPDGTTVHLYADSRIVFPTRFHGAERRVKLIGEAYFVVARDVAHPFFVRTPMAETQVLGTEFYIRSYGRPDDLIALVSGSISVNAGRQSIMLKPNEQAYFEADELVVGETDTMPYIAWRDGYLYFDNVELEDVMRAIGKNFNLNVEFRNTRLLKDRVHFVAARNEGVGKVIQTINRMGRINVWQEGNTLIVE